MCKGSTTYPVRLSHSWWPMRAPRTCIASPSWWMKMLYTGARGIEGRPFDGWLAAATRGCLALSPANLSPSLSEGLCLTPPLFSPHPCLVRSGSPLDEECDASAHKLSATAKQYLLIDTNVALHQVGGGAREGGEPPGTQCLLGHPGLPVSPCTANVPLLYRCVPRCRLTS